MSEAEANKTVLAATPTDGGQNALAESLPVPACNSARLVGSVFQRFRVQEII
jgi:hypothetical protein